jgi:hypothetical protein
MTHAREGGCACGAVRYRVKNAPFRTGVCHCKFCQRRTGPKCGTTVTWTLELFPDGRGVAGGTFDDPSWLEIERHTWTRSKQHWVPIPPEMEQFEKSAIQRPLKID